MNDDNWAKLQSWANAEIDPGPSCVLELLARVEALEANSKPAPNLRLVGGSLVLRVNDAVNAEVDAQFDDALECSRVAIREVAAWIREEYPSFQAMSAALEQEAQD